MAILFYSADPNPFPPEVPWVDTFTGDNGDPPNDVYWTLPANDPEIQNNALRMSCGPGVNNGNLRNTFNISGDFSAEVNWNILSGFNTTDGWAPIFEIRIDVNNRLFIYQNCYSSDLRLTCATVLGGSRVNNFGPSGNSYGKFRIRRSGSTWYGDYDVGPGWNQLGTRNIGSGDTTLTILWAQHWTNYPSGTVEWDNFTITQGTLIE